MEQLSLEEAAKRVVAGLPPLPEASRKMLSGHLDRALRGNNPK